MRLTLDEMEKIAKGLLRDADVRRGERSADVNAWIDSLDDLKLARALLLVLPVVRDAMRLYEKAEKCSDRPYMGCSMNHDSIVSALDSIDALRSALSHDADAGVGGEG